MSMFGGIDTSASGLTAERLRMDVISNNLANANTTRTPEGGAYHRRYVVFQPREYDESGEQPKLVDIGNGHFVFGDSKEIEQYKAIRFGA